MIEPTEDVTMTAVREPRRRASGVLVGVATLALIGAVAACQSPPAGPGDGGSTDATTTAPAPTATDEATDEATDQATDQGSGHSR